MKAEIDVVIPSRDRPARLAVCLEGLGRQTFASFRVIVVDDGSRTPIGITPPANLQEHGRLVVLRNESSEGAPASRNTGVAAGDAPYVVFLDDDIRPHAELLSLHHAVISAEPGPVVSLGPLVAPDDARLAPWDLWEADRLGREYRRLTRGDAFASWAHFYTGNAAVRREDLVAVGGFDVTLPREHDVELGLRLAQLGTLFRFEPRAVAWHTAERTLDEWLQLPRACAQADVLIDRTRPDSGWLAARSRERESRRWLLRAARRLLRHPTASRRAVHAATVAGRALYRVGAKRLALPAFSVAWELQYTRALAEATSAPEASRDE